MLTIDQYSSYQEINTEMCKQLLEAHKLLEKVIRFIDYEVDYYGADRLINEIEEYLSKAHAPE